MCSERSVAARLAMSAAVGLLKPDSMQSEALRTLLCMLSSAAWCWTVQCPSLSMASTTAACSPIAAVVSTPHFVSSYHNIMSPEPLRLHKVHPARAPIEALGGGRFGVGDGSLRRAAACSDSAQHLPDRFFRSGAEQNGGFLPWWVSVGMQVRGTSLFPLLP